MHVFHARVKDAFYTRILGRISSTCTVALNTRKNGALTEGGG